MDLISMIDGDVITRSAAPATGTYCFFRIQSGDRVAGGLTLITDLFDGKGETVAHDEKASPAINADSPIELTPQLPQGQYELVLKLMRGSQQLATVRRSFFLVNRPVVIQRILSYPLVLLPSRTALLIADIDVPAGLDPYIQWSQGKKPLASGRLREGYDQILWESPEDDGVYSIVVEVFPFPPATGDDFPFASSVKAAAELYISTKDEDRAAPRPASLKYNLFDVYISALRERERLRHDGVAPSTQLRQPVPAIIGDSIGMKFDGTAGFACPEFVFPVQAKTIESFTLTLGIKFDGETAGRNLLSAGANDGSLEMRLFFNDDGELVLAMKTKNNEYLFPSGIVKPQTGVRSLIEASVISLGGRLRVSWKENGAAAGQSEKAVTIDPGDRRGATLIGGANGVRCSIDTLDIVLQ